MDEKSAGYQKQETNLDHYKDEILEKGMWNLAVVDGRPKRCNDTMCRNCDFTANVLHGCRKRLIEWLKQPYIKPKYELTQFEYDLLQTYPRKLYRFKTMDSLTKMKEKGYFKGIDENATIEDILENCEITKFKKPLSEITKEEYIGLMLTIFEQIFNDDSDEEDDF